MAEMLKRDYDVVALKTELIDGPPTARDAATQVRFTVQYHVDRALEDGPVWTLPLAEIASPSTLQALQERHPGEGPPFELPAALTGPLRDWLNFHTEPDKPLWVHLVKPYGVLRFVPWERLLVRALERPLLMLPDFIFPPPRETASVLEVVVCGSAPLGHEDGHVRQAMLQTVHRILGMGLGTRRVRVHVFVDRQLVDGLRAEWQGNGQERGRLGVDVFVHDHDLAAPYASEDISSRLLDQTGSLRSPWLLWMRAALKGRSVDVLHFICHGYLTRERGALLFAQSPLERTEHYLSGPVGPAELSTFLTQVGAWSCVFTSLPDNHSEPGLRALADAIAQSRPGPLMMHSLREDPAADALAHGYDFLYARQRIPPPRSPAVFIYCQPYLAAAKLRDAAHASVAGEAPALPVASLARNEGQQYAASLALTESPLDSLYGGDENVSSRVAATERFAEQVRLNLQQLARDELLGAGASQQREVLASLDTLQRLVSAVAEIEKTAPKNGGMP